MIETSFTPIASAFGGALIGLAAVALMGLRGNIFGATGLLAGILRPSGPSDFSWRVSVLAGMLSGPLVYALITGGFPAIQVPVSTLSVVVGGVIVGIGVTYGSGCTSGHGVCGMARLSPRSIVATLTFMAGMAIAVYVTRHLLGWGA